jgi:hypothetical protein
VPSGGRRPTSALKALRNGRRADNWDNLGRVNPISGAIAECRKLLKGPKRKLSYFCCFFFSRGVIGKVNKALTLIDNGPGGRIQHRV